jgi:hypothetical protein
MNKATSVVAVAGVALSAGQASGREYVIWGQGSASCGEYVQAADAERKERPANAKPDTVYDRNYQAFVGFADGYLSGVNAVLSDGMVGKHSDHAGRMAWLENYCRAHPLSQYVEAVGSLWDDLSKEHRK